MHQVELRALNCEGYGGIADVVNVARAIAQTDNLVLAEPKLARLPDGKMANVPYKGDPQSLVEAVYKTREVDETERPLIVILGPESAWFDVITNLGHVDQSSPRPDRISIGLAFQMHSRQYTEASAVCTLWPSEREYIGPVADLFVQIADLFYSNLRPSFCWIGMAHGERLAGEPILERKLKFIYWVNYFGPPYVHKYGREYLLGGPGWRRKVLQDGGIFLQLGPRLTDASEGPSREELAKYFASAGVKKVLWPPDFRGGNC